MKTSRVLSGSVAGSIIRYFGAICLFVLVSVISVPLWYSMAADPVSNPPLDNAAPPINVSVTPQLKDGGLSVGSLISRGSVKVGSTTATCSNLTAGAVKYLNGNMYLCSDQGFNGGSGPDITANLEDLANVADNVPFSGANLVFNGATSQWQSQTNSLANLTDVATTTPTEGQTLAYSGGIWNPGKIIDWNVLSGNTYTTNTVTVGTSTIGSGLIFGVNGGIGADEICDTAGGNCSTPAAIFNSTLSSPWQSTATQVSLVDPAKSVRIQSGLGVGAQEVSGNYGTVQTLGGGKGGYEGYSINGRYAMMENGAGYFGLYNDVSDRWILQYNTTYTGLRNPWNRWVVYQTADSVRLYNQNGELALYGSENSHTYLYWNGSWRMRTTSSGIAVNGSISYSSDRNLKHNIQTTSGLATVTQLRGVDFTWNDSKQKSTGVIAQEVERIMPHLVETDEKGRKSVNYQGLIGPLVESVKELKHQNEELQTQINELTQTP